MLDSLQRAYSSGGFIRMDGHVPWKGSAALRSLCIQSSPQCTWKRPHQHTIALKSMKDLRQCPVWTELSYRCEGQIPEIAAVHRVFSLKWNSMTTAMWQTGWIIQNLEFPRSKRELRFPCWKRSVTILSCSRGQFPQHSGGSWSRSQCVSTPWSGRGATGFFVYRAKLDRWACGAEQIGSG